MELDADYCKQAASRLMNENTLFGNAKLQIELKPQPNKNPSPPRSLPLARGSGRGWHEVTGEGCQGKNKPLRRGTEGEVSMASALRQTPPGYKTRAGEKTTRARS